MSLISCTLTGIGEDKTQQVTSTLETSWETDVIPLAKVNGDAHITELGYRVRAVQSETARLREPAERELARQEAGKYSVASVSDDPEWQ